MIGKTYADGIETDRKKGITTPREQSPQKSKKGGSITIWGHPEIASGSIWAPTARRCAPEGRAP